MEFVPVFLERALVCENYLKSLVQISKLLEPVAQSGVIEVKRFKYLAVGIESYLRAPLACASHNFKRMLRHAALEGHFVSLAVLVNFRFQPFGKRVHTGNAHAVQTAGKFISAAAEFTARMQFGKHHFHSGFSFLFYYTRGNTASVIGDGYASVFLQFNQNGIAISRHSFVHGVIHNLVNQMMQSALIGRTDVHTRSLSHRLKTFQHLYCALIVLFFSHFFTSLVL